MKALLILCFAFLLTGALSAQDYHFSQPYAAPLYLNPALTGAFNGGGRAAVKYRNQWNSVVGAQAYNTFMAAVDGRFFDFHNWFGFGGFAYYDFAGDSEFRTLHVGGSGAYHFALSRNHYLVAAQAGGVQYEVGNPNLLFDRQFDGRRFNGQLSHREGLRQLRSSWMLDLSPGLAFYDNEREYIIGASVFHVTQPQYSFLGEAGGARLSPRWVAHAFVPVTRSRGLSLAARGLYMKQRQSWQSLLGPAAYFYLDRKEENVLFGSVMVRGGNNFRETKSFTVDALVLSVRLDQGPWSVGFSYDVNVSPLRAASRSVGALEFSLVYIWEGESGAVRCPRYF